MWVKICGIVTAEAARCSIDAGADAIGFVFAESRRKISIETAGEIIKGFPGRIEKVGVFVNMAYREVAAITEYLRLDLLQFHGQESPEYCSLFSGKAIKAFSIGRFSDLDTIPPYISRIRACLLDTYQEGQRGGSGKSWDWPVMAGYIEEVLAGTPLIAAGGLNAGNVGKAIKTLKPYGVDTSSGVEKEGQKDCLLIKKFVEEVRRWENE